MNDTTRRQVLLLLCLMAVLAAVVGYQMWGRATAGTGQATSNPVSAAAAPSQGTLTVTDVRLDLLEREPEAYRAPERNPFRFRPRPSPVVARRAEAPPPIFTLPPPQPAGPAPIRRIRVRYIGYILDRAARLVAQLRDEESGAVVQRQAGDIIEGKYRLLSVTPDWIEVSYLDGRGGRQRIPLGQ